VLGIPRTASDGEIQAAYRARMREYHPDKVAHLGEELQKLAHRKSQEIQRAYQKLRR
jgi:DnaJ like chaperone protein